MPTPAYTNLDSNKPSGSDSPTTYATDNLNNIRALRDMVITGRAAGFVQTRTQGTGPDVARPQYITWLNSSLQVGFRMKSTWGGTGNCQQTSVEWEWTNDNGSSWTTLGTAQANTFDANDNITATTNSGGFVALVMEMWTKLLRYVGAIKVDAATNNVGIGTSSPGCLLNLKTATNSITETLRLQNDNNVADNGNKVTWRNAGTAFEAAYVGATRVGASVNYALTFATSADFSAANATERMRIDGSGNVAIKTVGAWLGFPDSGGALSAFGNGMFIGTSGQQLRLIAGNSDGTIAFSTTSTAGVANERMRIDSSGNVGIGTSSLGYKLVVTDTNKAVDSPGNVYIYTTDTAAADKGAQLTLGGSYTGTTPAPMAGIAGRYNGTAIGGYLSLMTLSAAGAITERMRIDSSGNVGIGKTAESGYACDVQGYVRSNGADFAGVLIQATNSGGKQWRFLGGSTSGTSGDLIIENITDSRVALRLTPDGRVYGSALHNNAGSVTGTTNQYIASGTMANGNATAVTNVSGTPTYQTMTWMRVGNVVTCAGTVTAGATTANTACTIRFPLPIASGFTASEDCVGTGIWTTGDNGEPVRVIADVTNDQASVRWVPTSTTNTVIPIHFTYLIK